MEYVKAAESPEGESCGLVLQRTPSLRICMNPMETSCVNLILETYAGFQKIVKTFGGKKYGCVLFVNGTPEFFSIRNVQDTVSTLREMKSTQVLPYDCSIIPEPALKCCYIYTTSGRVMRPLLKLNNIKNFLKDECCTLNDCISKGYVEYVTKHEEMSW